MKPPVLPVLVIDKPKRLSFREEQRARDISRMLLPELRPGSIPLGEVSSRELPKTYELVSSYENEKDPNNPLNSHAYQQLLPHIERMSKQGMSLKFIAARLGVALFALEEAVRLFPDVNGAILGGLARGVDEQSEAMYRRGLGEDTSAGKFFLQTRGEFNPPAQGGPTVTVNIGNQPAAVTTIEVDSMAERQRLLLEGDVMDLEELG